jgi:hypothetical protein
VAPEHERLRKFPSSAIVGVATAVGVEAALEAIIVLVVVVLLARSDTALKVATRIILIGILPPIAAVHPLAGASRFFALVLAFGEEGGDLFASFIPHKGGFLASKSGKGLGGIETRISRLCANAGDGFCAQVDGVSIHKITSK